MTEVASCPRNSITRRTLKNTQAFFLDKQPDALIIPILFCYKSLHVLGIFSAHRQEYSTVHSALASFMLVSDDRFQAESGWNVLTLFGSGHQKPA